MYSELVKPTGADFVEKPPEPLKQIRDHSALTRQMHRPTGPAWMIAAPPAQLSMADALQLGLAMLTYIIQRRKKG